ncbi:uncharacterized protein LOC131620218 [Vicia villosa]|uniref:uncharacterized protein LOC131620218 n=1 Tax=Vicia villosa TaxID=3911 RepID=UPI00273B06BA|nr:uncharacterized protein LOC131620218 [Vicia villosa]
MPNGKQWNHELVLSLVGEEVAQKVQNTPLFISVRDDKLHWRYEKDGKFSICSAYRYCINEAIDTSHLRINEKWNLLWNIKTPPRVKNFLWRLCRDCVPTRRRLLDKGVSCPAICVSNHDHLSLFSVILWRIWKGRNNHIWNSAEEPTEVICQRAAQLLAGWKNAQQHRLNSEINNPSPIVTRWCKPSAGRLKCNIDASFSQNKVGISIYIRNDAGQFIAARTEWFSPCTYVAIGEAIGLLTTIKWVINLGFDNMDFELDAKQVVDDVNSVKPNDSDFGAIVDDCKRLITLFFRNSHVKFVRRQANEVPHALARVAPSLASFHNFTDIPTCIQNIIINEMI